MTSLPVAAAPLPPDVGAAGGPAKPEPRRRLGRPAPFAPTLVIAAAMVGSACTPKPPSADLFPLEAGHRWTYRQVIDWEDDTRDVSSLVLRTTGTEDFEGKPAFHRRSDDGLHYWLRRDETGIYRIASRHELTAEPTKDPAPRFVLKEPLAVGTEWQSQTVAYLLKRRQGFPPEIRHEGKPVTMRYEIEALNETVTVPAGRYEGCLRLRGQASLRLYADPVAGWRDMPLTTTEWYCRGPGLVKLERNEPATRMAYLTGGRLTLELDDWSRP